MSVFDGSHGHAVTIDGYVRVDAAANLELIGTIHNDGMIDVDGQKADLVIDGSVTLDGGGVITLDNAAHPADQIVGVSDTEEHNTLYNVDNTIEAPVISAPAAAVCGSTTRTAARSMPICRARR